MLPPNRKCTKSAFAKAKVYPKCFHRRRGAAVSWEVLLPHGRCHHYTGGAAVAQEVPFLHGRSSVQKRHLLCNSGTSRVVVAPPSHSCHLPSIFHVDEGPSVNISCMYKTVHQFQVRREDFPSSNAIITAFLFTSSVSTRPSYNLWCGSGNFNQSPGWRRHFPSTSCAEAVLWCGNSTFRPFTGWPRYFRCIDWSPTSNF